MWITIDVNNKHLFLGMQVSLEQDIATIDMTNFINELIDDYMSLWEYTSPAAKRWTQNQNY